MSQELSKPKADLEKSLHEFIGKSNIEGGKPGEVVWADLEIDRITLEFCSKLKQARLRPTSDELQVKRLKQLRSFQANIGRIRNEQKEKLASIQNQFNMEKEDFFNIFETHKDQRTNSPFGLNDSFHMKHTPGPGVTPTQITKSGKDNSRSFDEVPSFFNAQNKSQKSDIQKDAKDASPHKKEETHKSFTLNPNMSFEEPKNNNQNILDDSFGVKPDQGAPPLGNVLDDSFGFKAGVQDEIHDGAPGFGEVIDENENLLDHPDFTQQQDTSKSDQEPLFQSATPLHDEGTARSPGYNAHEASESNFFLLSSQLAKYYSYPANASKPSSYPKDNKRNHAIEKCNRRLIQTDAGELRVVLGGGNPLKE